jgi:hypothetical protein
VTQGVETASDGSELGPSTGLGPNSAMIKAIARTGQNPSGAVAITPARFARQSSAGAPGQAVTSTSGSVPGVALGQGARK